MKESDKQNLIEILEAQQKTIAGLQDMMSVVADRLERLELFREGQITVNQVASDRLDGINAAHERLSKAVDRLVAIQEDRNQRQDEVTDTVNALDHIQHQHDTRLERLEIWSGWRA